MVSFKSPFRNLPYEKKGHLTLASGFLLHFILGTFYMWGSISTYIASYLQHDGQDISKEIVGAVFPFTFLAINIGTPIGPLIAQKIGFRLYLQICGTALGIIVIISSFVIANFYLFVFLYGFCFGLLTGLMYMVPFATGYIYFPKKKGLVSGIITGGFGFGACVFIWVMFGLINPDNEKASVVIHGTKYFSQTVCDRLPNAIRVLGIIQIVGISLSNIMHERPQPEEIVEHEKLECEMSHQKVHNTEHHSPPLGSGAININMQHDQLHIDEHHSHDHGIHEDHHDEHPIYKDGIKSDHPDPQSVENGSQIIKPSSSSGQMSTQSFNVTKYDGEDYYEFETLKDGMRTKFIYLSVLLNLIYVAYGSMTVSNYKLYGEYQGYEDSFLSAAGTAGSVFNGISRMFWGSLMEKFKIKKIIYSNLILQIAISITYQYAAKIQALFLIYVVLGYFVYGGWYSVMPALISRIYGKKIGTTIFGVTYIGYTLASFTQFFIVALVQDAIGWGRMFFVFTGIQGFAVIITYFVQFKAVPPKIQEILNRQKEKSK